MYRRLMEALGNNACFWVTVATLFSVLVIFLAVSDLARASGIPRLPGDPPPRS